MWLDRKTSSCSLRYHPRFKKLGIDPVLLGHTSTAQDPREFPPNDPILRETHAAMPGLDSPEDVRGIRTHALYISLAILDATE
jgi:hypothetical protein